MANRENKPSPVARESSVYSTIYKRKDAKGWWVGWYESDKRKAKALPTKELAEYFKWSKYLLASGYHDQLHAFPLM